MDDKSLLRRRKRTNKKMWFDGAKRYHHRVLLNDSGEKNRDERGEKIEMRNVRDGVLLLCRS